MALKLMYITNDENIAKLVENSGVDWIFIDLEINGKEDRQGHLNTVISRHHIDDVRKIKRILTKAQLLVRVNPIFESSEFEINKVIDDGADIVMLPFFKTKEEVETFVKIVNGRAKTCLLLETSEAVKKVDDVLSVQGIDYIHIGLNDLHLSYNLKFMFELLADGTVERLCKKFRARGITYGFGGIASLGKGALPAEYIIAEHYRLGSSMAILSRSFCNVEEKFDFNTIEYLFNNGVDKIRAYENRLFNESKIFFETNKKFLKDKIIDIVESRRSI